MEKDFEVLSNKKISNIWKLLNEYFVYLDGQKVGIKTFIDDNGYYQMDTSYYYRGGNAAGVYITSAANFESEEKALSNAKRQLLAFYDGNGEWKLNDEY